MNFTASASVIRLNLGCWVFRRDSIADREAGWVNVDLNPDYAPDLIADAALIPYADGTVEEIYAGHLLEHMRPDVDALREWHRVLVPGGLLVVVVPDIYRALREFWEGRLDRDFLNSVAFGGADDHAAMQMHQRIYTGDILKHEMQVAGFTSLQYVVDAGIPWQIGVSGRKGAA